MKRIILSAFAVLSVLSVALASDTIRVACVGNSITTGYALKNPSRDSYPSQLQRMLGDGYLVGNFGVGGRTLMNKGDYPYMNEQAYRDALAFQPDIVTIKLGSNDSKAYNWQYSATFKDDLRTLIRSFQSLKSHPRIYLCYPIPAHQNQYTINDSIILHGIIPSIDQVAKEMKLPVIDLYSLYQHYLDLTSSTDSHHNYLPDGVHPDPDGAGILANEICRFIKNGDVKVPELKADEAFVVTMKTTMGTIKFRLYNETPLHRDNFYRLVKQHFFDGILFHRVIKNFVVQGGDPDSRTAKKGQALGEHDAGYTIAPEFRTELGYLHKRGVLNAAREGDETNPRQESSSSQFCFMAGDAPHLDGKYTVFGQVIEGMDVVDRIQVVKTDQMDRPLDDVRILKAKITKKRITPNS